MVPGEGAVKELLPEEEESGGKKKGSGQEMGPGEESRTTHKEQKGRALGFGAFRRRGWLCHPILCSAWQNLHNEGVPSSRSRDPDASKPRSCPCCTSSPGATSRARRAWIAAAMTPSTLSSREKRSRKRKPASKRRRKTLPTSRSPNSPAWAWEAGG